MSHLPPLKVAKAHHAPKQIYGHTDRSAPGPSGSPMAKGAPPAHPSTRFTALRSTAAPVPTGRPAAIGAPHHLLDPQHSSGLRSSTIYSSHSAKMRAEAHRLNLPQMLPSVPLSAAPIPAGNIAFKGAPLQPGMPSAPPPIAANPIPPPAPNLQRPNSVPPPSSKWLTGSQLQPRNEARPDSPWSSPSLRPPIAAPSPTGVPPAGGILQTAPLRPAPTIPATNPPGEKAMVQPPSDQSHTSERFPFVSPPATQNWPGGVPPAVTKNPPIGPKVPSDPTWTQIEKPDAFGRSGGGSSAAMEEAEHRQRVAKLAQQSAELDHSIHLRQKGIDDLAKHLINKENNEDLKSGKR